MLRKEGVDVVPVVEVEMVVNVTNHSTSEQVTTKLLSVLSGEDESSLQEPGHQGGPRHDAVVLPHVVGDVVEDLVHADRQVVLYEHGGDGPGGLV